MMSFFLRRLKDVFGVRTALSMRLALREPSLKKMNVKTRKLYSSMLKKGDLYFDIGANYGQKLEAIALDGYKIVALEPQEICCDYLRNVFGNLIEVVPKGVAAQEDAMTLYRSNMHPLSSFSEIWVNKVQASNRFANAQWIASDQIQMTTLDKLIDQYGIPGLVKIDAEGFEYEILQGLSHKVDFLSFEYTMPEREDELLRCLGLLNKLYEGKVSFNYSPGESMELALSSWLSFSQMLNEIESDNFQVSGAGDIYVRSLSS